MSSHYYFVWVRGKSDLIFLYSYLEETVYVLDRTLMFFTERSTIATSNFTFGEAGYPMVLCPSLLCPPHKGHAAIAVQATDTRAVLPPRYLNSDAAA